LWGSGAAGGNGGLGGGSGGALGIYNQHHGASNGGWGAGNSIGDIITQSTVVGETANKNDEYYVLGHGNANEPGLIVLYT
jgi:hypothetical protein